MGEGAAGWDAGGLVGSRGHSEVGCVSGEAGRLFGACCGSQDCQHDTPTSQKRALRRTGYRHVGVKAEMPGVGSAPPSALCHAPPSPRPQLRKVSLNISICICGNLGPERASHLSRDTQLLSKDLSLGLSCPSLSSEVLLELKSWEQASGRSAFVVFVCTVRVPSQHTGVLY